jgi:hypothetical protein
METERRVRVLGTPASYSRGPEFQHVPGSKLSSQMFNGFHQSLQTNDC